MIALGCVKQAPPPTTGTAPTEPKTLLPFLPVGSEPLNMEEVRIQQINRQMAFVENNKPPTPEPEVNVTLKLVGTGFEVIKGIRVVNLVAKGPDQKIFKLTRDSFNRDADGEFRKPKTPFGFKIDPTKDELTQKFALEVPVDVKAMSLSGTIELLVPSEDSESVVIVDLKLNQAEPLDNAVLKEVGVEMKKIKASVENDQFRFQYDIKDPKHQIGPVEFFNPNGVIIPTPGFGVFSLLAWESHSYEFAEVPPTGSTAQFYVKTEKSVRLAPFEFQDQQINEIR